ncbi:hypothetical protein Pla22_40510 [Rubripirellula amarantea]|uniref:DUF2141 domain-containing protein n=1 Tax=Rubripirellula amarantea TaxID=2527999 RepID=A0A5C5WKH8_9BACT|nr:DUF2141 domain-containing protein [Rubripirellula amarantea]TWT51274.1 hypothetical protein Pla22_40510 [Rubripirellula amarantea]
MVNQTDLETQPDYSDTHRELWRQNHLSILLAFAFAVFLIGSGILLYRQNRFVPPRFPDSESITSASGNNTSDDIQLPKDSLLIGVAGAANDQGEMKLAIYDSPESFNDIDASKAKLSATIVNGETVFLLPIEALPERFAVAVFHDENLDGELNRNRFGIPSERYGYSRDARGLTGPPKFSDAVINRPKPGEILAISIR